MGHAKLKHWLGVAAARGRSADVAWLRSERRRLGRRFARKRLHEQHRCGVDVAVAHLQRLRALVAWLARDGAERLQGGRRLHGNLNASHSTVWAPLRTTQAADAKQPQPRNRPPVLRCACTFSSCAFSAALPATLSTRRRSRLELRGRTTEAVSPALSAENPSRSFDSCRSLGEVVPVPWREQMRLCG